SQPSTFQPLLLPPARGHPASVALPLRSRAAPSMRPFVRRSTRSEFPLLLTLSLRFRASDFIADHFRTVVLHTHSRAPSSPNFTTVAPFAPFARPCSSVVRAKKKRSHRPRSGFVASFSLAFTPPPAPAPPQNAPSCPVAPLS